MKVAVIGAGISGLFCIKSCLEDNLSVQCFEKTDQLGGVWVYRSQYNEDDPTGVYDGLKCNGSSLFIEASDFPSQILEDLPSREQQLEYTQQYAKHFGLDKHITFNCTVISVEPEGDDWLVTRSENDEVKTDKFNAVLVCTGRFHKPIIPDIPGFDKFQGHVLTSKSFKNKRQTEIKDKVVLIIGNSYSAADIAGVIAESTKQVYTSIGKGSTCLTIMHGTIPLDTLMLNNDTIYSGDPMVNLNALWMNNVKRFFPDQKQYGIWAGEVMIKRPFLYTAQDLPGCIRSGRILVKPQVTELTETGAVFNDGTTIEVDTVLTATGYDTDFPFLSKDIIADNVSDLKLYKFTWPLTTKRHNLAIMGCVHLSNALAPFLEIQARWAVRVIQNKTKLPDRKTMASEIEKRNSNVLEIFGKNTAQPDGPGLYYHNFMAAEIGALPTWWHYLLTNPRLAYILRYGPAFNGAYRLVGPHKWRKADARIVEQYRHWRARKGDGWGFWSMAGGVGAVVGVAMGIWWMKKSTISTYVTKL